MHRAQSGKAGTGWIWVLHVEKIHSASDLLCMRLRERSSAHSRVVSVAVVSGLTPSSCRQSDATGVTFAGGMEVVHTGHFQMDL